MEFRASFKFQKFKVALNFASYPSYPNSIMRKKSPCSLKYKYLKLKLRVFLAGHTVAMVTYSVIKMKTTYLPMIWQFFDTMIAVSIDNEW